MQIMKERGGMNKFGTTEDESSSMALNFLEFFKEVFGEPASTELQ